MPLLTPLDSNPKTAKRAKEWGYVGGILHLLSARQAHEALGIARGTVCPMAERNGCASACVVNQGRGRMSNVYAARLRRSALYLQDRERFHSTLWFELIALERRAERTGRRAVVRLDGTSDLGEALHYADAFRPIQFYDYTKVYARALRVHEAHGRGQLLNYHVTFSRGSGNEAEALDLLSRGINATVVFRIRSRSGGPLPIEWKGYPVIDGDEHDFRFRDPSGVVVGLRAKGTAFADRTGFVAEVE